MKANKFYLLLVVLVMVIATIACGSTTPSSKPFTPKPVVPTYSVASPTKVPTQKPAPTQKPVIESYCLTGDDWAYLVESLSDISPTFALGKEFEYEYIDENLPSYMMGLMYEDDNTGCLEVVASVVVNHWSLGEPGLAGEYMGAVAGMSQDDVFQNIIMNNLEKCVQGSVEKEHFADDGGIGYFTCEDEGDFYNASVMYIFP